MNVIGIQMDQETRTRYWQDLREAKINLRLNDRDTERNRAIAMIDTKFYAKTLTNYVGA